jgi:hypothetical protein
MFRPNLKRHTTFMTDNFLHNLSMQIQHEISELELKSLINLIKIG